MDGSGTGNDAYNVHGTKARREYSTGTNLNCLSKLTKVRPIVQQKNVTSTASPGGKVTRFAAVDVVTEREGCISVFRA